MFKKIICIGAVMVFVAGCSSTVEVRKDEAASSHIFAVPEFTQTVTDKIPLTLTVNPQSGNLDDVVVKAKSSLSEYGFILDEKGRSSFATAAIKGEFKETSNFGGFSKHLGQLSVSLSRTSDKKFIAQKDFEVRGERARGAFESKSKVAAELAAQMGAWMKEQVFGYSSGLDSVAVTINFDEFRRSWFKWFEQDRDEDLALDVTKFTNGAEKRNGILSCQLIATQGEDYTFRFIYLRKDFPNGLVSRSINSADVEVEDGDPVDGLLDIIINSNTTAQ